MITIVIPTYNNLPYLSRCLETLFDYTVDVDYRVVVVDGSDNKETQSYFSKFAAQGRNVCVSTGTNLGFIGAVNRGLLETMGEDRDILILNDDTQVVDTYWLASMCNVLRSGTEIGAVGAVSNYVAGIQGVQYSSELPLTHETNLLSGFCMLIKRDAFAKVGKLDERFGMNMSEDFDYCIRLREAGYQVWVDRSAFVWHYGSRTLMRDEAEKAKFNERLKMGEQILVDKWGLERWNKEKELPNSLKAWIARKLGEQNAAAG